MAKKAPAATDDSAAATNGKGGILRAPAEVLYATELEALIAEDKHERPPGWKMSPRAALTYICGGKAGKLDISAKYIGHQRLVEIAIATLVTTPISFPIRSVIVLICVAICPGLSQTLQPRPCASFRYNYQKDQQRMPKVRDPSTEPFDTRTLLAQANTQAIERRYEDFMIVDVDSHHYENDSLSEIIEYIDDPVLRHASAYNRGTNRTGSEGPI